MVGGCEMHKEERDVCVRRGKEENSVTWTRKVH